MEEFVTRRVIRAIDVWFEPSEHGAQLMIAVAAPAPHGPPPWVVIDDIGWVFLRHVADIKGQRVYAASREDPTGSSAPPEPETSWLLQGPFGRGSPDGA
jgi:hypothetical protein